jgi:hypothetical protein
MKNEVQIRMSVVDAIHNAVTRASKANQKKWAAKRSRKRSKVRKLIREWEADREKSSCWSPISCEWANRTIWDWCQMEGLGLEDYRKLVIEFDYEYMPESLNK